MEQLEDYLNTALVNLCRISVSGPPVVQMGRAVEAVSLALTEVKRLQEEQKKAKTEEDEGDHESS